MHAPDVPGKVRFLSELPRALFTLEGSFTSVASLMALRKQVSNLKDEKVVFPGEKPHKILKDPCRSSKTCQRSSRIKIFKGSL